MCVALCSCERLVSEQLLHVSSNGSFCCFNSAVHVAVWDEGGLCFHGRYRCGLGRDPATGVYRYFRAPLSLVFGGNNPMDFLQR